MQEDETPFSQRALGQLKSLHTTRRSVGKDTTSEMYGIEVADYTKANRQGGNKHNKESKLEGCLIL